MSRSWKQLCIQVLSKRKRPSLILLWQTHRSLREAFVRGKAYFSHVWRKSALTNSWRCLYLCIASMQESYLCPSMHRSNFSKFATFVSPSGMFSKRSECFPRFPQSQHALIFCSYSFVVQTSCTSFTKRDKIYYHSLTQLRTTAKYVRNLAIPAASRCRRNNLQLRNSCEVCSKNRFFSFTQHEGRWTGFISYTEFPTIGVTLRFLMTVETS